MPNASGRKRVHDDDGSSDCGVVWDVVVGALVVSDMFVEFAQKKRDDDYLSCLQLIIHLRFIK